MANYITTIGQLIGEAVTKLDRPVLFGENISTGSKLVGLCKFLPPTGGHTTINVGNCEPTHCGIGFGLMMTGVTSILFVKQLDFMLLGVDHFVSTYNFVRAQQPHGPRGSFSIVTVVCDQGHQGPQSSFNALGNLCSMAQIPGFCLNTEAETKKVLFDEVPRPGFRMIALSQRLFGAEIIATPPLFSADDASLFQYSDGGDATILSFNFSLPYAIELEKQMAAVGKKAAVFSLQPTGSLDVARLSKSIQATGRVVAIDDSKCRSPELYHVLSQLPHAPRTEVVVRDRIDFGVSAEEMLVPYDKLIKTLFG